ncbi:bZIP transcription factor [Paenibacillus sp. QZ-Y1]|uniref:bZIP transcription factor n=1 Tax=Paenibacillus sp. QZ-Y1 TaxID=3414511 RepID=UPI003F7A6949
MKIVTGILLTAAFLTLTACSSTPTTATNDTQSGNTSAATTATTTETPKEPVEPKEEVEAVASIKKGETVTIEDFADITVTSNKIAKKIEPSKPGRFYTYYQSKEADSSYFALILKAKNLSTEGITADKIAEVSLKYDNKYDYDTFSTIEKRGGEDFTYTNITDIDPLKTGTIYYLVEIPNEVAKSDKPLKAEIKIQDQTFEYTVR